MAEQCPRQNIIEKVKDMPLGSAVIGLAGVGVLTNAFNLGALIFAAPIASAGIAFRGLVGAFDKKRSGLSRVFSAAAAVVGAVGAIAPFAISGPEALGALVISLGAMAVGGAFNVASYFLRNKKLPVTISIKREDAPKQTVTPAPLPVA